MSSHWLPISEPLPLSRDAVHVVRVPLQADDDQIALFQSLLSPDESARADRFKVPQPRRHFIVCRATLRRLLAACLNCKPTDVEFEYGLHGKPSLRSVGGATSRIQFSVSHSADHALIAIAMDRQVGIDLEFQDPAVRILKLAKRFFSPRESAELAGLKESDQLAGFFRCWTCKEAYLKGTGFGLSFSLSKFSVSVDPYQPAKLLEVVDQPEELDRWRLISLHPAAAFSAALLIEAKADDQVKMHLWAKEAASNFSPCR